MGRPSKYKPEYCDLLAKHLSSGLSMDAFCGVVKVSRETLYNWLKEFPDFLDTKKENEDAARLIWEQIGMNGALGKIKNFNVVAWIFIMKNRFKWRDRQPEEVDESKAFVLAYEVKKKSK